MYPELGENLNYAHFDLQRVLVILGQLRKKASKLSGNQFCLDFKGQIILVTDEKAQIYISNSKSPERNYLEKQLISNLHAVAPFHRNFFTLPFD